MEIRRQTPELREREVDEIACNADIGPARALQLLMF